MVRATIGGVELLGSDLDRIRPTNLRVPVVEFAALWVFAERHCEAHPQDWYAAGVVMTCRWLANAVVRPPWGRWYVAFAPVTERSASAYEELIAAELQAAEVLDMRRPVPAWLAARPGWLPAVLATLKWAWARSGVPPLTVPRQAAG